MTVVWKSLLVVAVSAIVATILSGWLGHALILSSRHDVVRLGVVMFVACAGLLSLLMFTMCGRK